MVARNSKQSLLKMPSSTLNKWCSEKKPLQGNIETLESKTRWMYILGLLLIIMNHLVDQIAPTIGIAELPTFLFMAGALFLLLVRFLSIAVNCRGRQVLTALLFINLSLVSWVLSGQSYLLTATFLILGVGSLDIRKVIRSASSFIFLVVALLALLQLIQFIVTGDLSGAVVREGNRLRLSFFFQHPNVLAAHIAMSYIGFSVYDRVFKGSTIILGCVLAVICVWVTDSRTAGIIMAVYIILRMIAKKVDYGGRIPKLIYALTPLLMIVLVLFATISILPEGLYDLLQKVLSGRPGYWELQYQQLGGFTLLGQHALSGTVVVDGWTHVNVTIDCFYAAALLSLGLWSLLVFYLLYLKAGLRACRERDFEIMIALFCCALYGLTEIHMIDLSIAFPMLFLGARLFCAEKRELVPDGERE